VLSAVRNILKFREAVLLRFGNEAVLKFKYFARKDENEEGKRWGSDFVSWLLRVASAWHYRDVTQSSIGPKHCCLIGHAQITDIR
jgi:hypothetical protein